MKFIKSIIPYAVILILVIGLKTFVFTPVQVIGKSMEPTLIENEIMFLDKISYRFSDIERFDIVVAKSIYDDSKLLIKRVIGLPFEIVEYKDNVLYIDGSVVEESFSHGETIDFSMEDIEEIKILEDTYFLVGDNRMVSRDSRRDGLFSRDAILGRTNFIFFPFNNFGFVE